MTCSYSCSNTYFRSGEKHPKYKGTNYRVICFKYHKKECVVCGESNVIEVHHHDKNRENNAPENLIPLCPTHHRYWHSCYRKKIEKQVVDYRNNWITENKIQKKKEIV